MADGAGACGGLRDERNVCQLCGALENLSLCGGCRDTWYCCKDHQRAHWRQHKQECKGKRPKVSSTALIGQEAGSAARLDTVTASGSVAYREPAEKQTTGSRVVISHSLEPADTSLLQSTDVANQALEGCLADSTTSISSSSVLSPDSATQAFKEGFLADSTTCIGISTNSSQSLDTLLQSQPSCFATPEVPKSRSPAKKSGDSSGHRDFVSTQQLPVISEEGSSERFFLDVRPFSQPLQSSRLSARGQRSGRTMAPQNPDNVARSNDAYLKVMNSRFSTIASYVVDCLKKYGICVIDQFMGDATGREILAEVKELKDRGVMRRGQVVQSSTATADNIRGDIITWVDGRRKGSSTDNINYLVSCMDLVVQKCSSLMERYSINERTKAMVACYPGKATGYVRHVDNPSGDGRCITCIYYLNQDWDCKIDGGMLRIYPEGRDSVANIAPNFDRLLFFWSDRRNPHEVMPSMRERFAITVWYYEAEERARALKKFKGDPDDNPKKQSVPLFNGAGSSSGGSCTSGTSNKSL